MENIKKKVKHETLKKLMIFRFNLKRKKNWIIYVLHDHCWPSAAEGKLSTCCNIKYKNSFS